MKLNSEFVVREIQELVTSYDLKVVISNIQNE